MSARFVLLLLCVATLVLAVTPAALAGIEIGSVFPQWGNAGSLVTVTVFGDFPSAERPLFTLSGVPNGLPQIQGVTGEWSAQKAIVTFALPVGSEKTYDLVVQQGASWTAEFAAFGVADDVPVLSSLDPGMLPTGEEDVILRLTGANFDATTVVFWNRSQSGGVDPDPVRLSATIDSTTVLRAVVPSSELGTPGMASVHLVRSEPPVPPGHKSSGILTCTIVEWAAPVITTLDPASVSAGSPAFELAVGGSGFATGIGGAIVLWNGTALTTRRDSADHLTATVPDTMVTAAGTATVTVRNGGLGARVSNALAFTIAEKAPAAIPAITSITPSQVWAGSVRSETTLTVTGSGFTTASRISLGSVIKMAGYVDGTRLTLPLLPGDIASAGTIKVGVMNPPFPPGTPSAATVPLEVRPETTDPSVIVDGAGSGWHNAPVRLTFLANDLQSGVQKVQYVAPPAVPTWTDGTAYVVPVDKQGAVTVTVQAFDWCDRVGTASAVVHIDTTPPETATLGRAAVRKGRTAILRYRVSEPSDLSPSADVRILVKRRNGTVARTLEVAGAQMNKNISCRFKCGLRKGTYTWYVYATDLAGNVQANVATAKLVVR
jgi:hypothetical protein